MEYPTRLNEFLKTICEQIRWKKVHRIILEEIRNHVTDQKNAFVEQGLDEETAMERAIEEMGDPILIGTELDRTHRPKLEWNIFFLTGIMLVFGFATRYLVSLEPGISSMWGKSLLTSLIGLACMLTLYFLDFTFIARYPKSIFATISFLSIILMFLSPVVRGKHLYVQFILLLFPTAFAGIIYNMRSKGYLGIILSGIFLIIPVLIGLRIPSMSAVALISICFLILITISIIKGWFNVNKLYGILLVYIPSLALVATGFIKAMFYSYKRERFLRIINPSKDPLGWGYISGRMRELLTGAKFIGRGDLGVSSNMLPEINTNYILTYLIHRLGWLSFIIVVGIILFFIIKSFRLCLKQKSILGRLVSISVVITFAMEVIFYTITNLGLPIMGSLTLPFISYSGMSTIVNMALIGIMLSVFRTGDTVRDSLTLQKNN